MYTREEEFFNIMVGTNVVVVLGIHMFTIGATLIINIGVMYVVISVFLTLPMHAQVEHHKFRYAPCTQKSS